MQEAEIEGGTASFPVEGPRLFSQSLIWDLQRQFYEQHGIEAWGEGRIPFGISTSPHIAMAYSRVVFGFLRDWLPKLDLDAPVYIVELGAGSGRLGFNFLKSMAEFYPESALRNVPFTYVLTDLVERNVEFWQQHAALAPFAEAGQLDFARFDAINDTELVLRHSGKVIRPGELRNPLIVLANYIFDTLPQDLFSIEDGEVFAVTTALTSAQPEPNLKDPELIGRIQLEYDRQPVSDDFYGDEHTARILAYYRANLDGTVIMFPRDSLVCIEAFRQMSGGRMLLLTGDKGDHRLEDYQRRDIPSLTLHDTGFSLTVNYNAIMQYFQNLGGQAIATSFDAVSLNIIACALGGQPLVETRQAFRDFIDYNSPDDNFTAFVSSEKNPEASLIELIAMIRTKRYDTHSFLLIYPLLAKKFPGMPISVFPELRRVVARLWDAYYELNERHNLPFHLGVILAAIGDYQESLFFFERSLERSPGHTTTLFNMANSFFNLGQLERATNALDELPEEYAQRPEVQALRERIGNAGA